MNPNNQKSGLAVTSLVLGILSILGCTFFTGVPAIICGIKARQRVRTQPETYGGDGLALGGIITGSIGSVLIVVIAILAALLLPALAKAKHKAQSISCLNQMKQIGLAARLYANDHEDNFPSDFLTMSNELSAPKVLICPADGARTRMADWSQFSPENVSYIYTGDELKADASSAQEVILTCPTHGHTGLGDGRVQQNRSGMGRR